MRKPLQTRKTSGFHTYQYQVVSQSLVLETSLPCCLVMARTDPKAKWIAPTEKTEKLGLLVRNEISIVGNTEFCSNENLACVSSGQPFRRFALRGAGPLPGLSLAATPPASILALFCQRHCSALQSLLFHGSRRVFVLRIGPPGLSTSREKVGQSGGFAHSLVHVPNLVPDFRVHK